MDLETARPVAADIDDAALVESARHEQHAFDLLYHRYVDRVYRYCYSHTGKMPRT